MALQLVERVEELLLNTLLLLKELNVVDEKNVDGTVLLAETGQWSWVRASRCSRS